MPAIFIADIEPVPTINSVPIKSDKVFIWTQPKILFTAPV